MGIQRVTIVMLVLIIYFTNIVFTDYFKVDIYTFSIIIIMRYIKKIYLLHNYTCRLFISSFYVLMCRRSAKAASVAYHGISLNTSATWFWYTGEIFQPAHRRLLLSFGENSQDVNARSESLKTPCSQALHSSRENFKSTDGSFHCSTGNSWPHMELISCNVLLPMQYFFKFSIIQ